jgi:hypothetical protein
MAWIEADKEASPPFEDVLLYADGETTIDG